MKSVAVPESMLQQSWMQGNTTPYHFRPSDEDRILDKRRQAGGPFGLLEVCGPRQPKDSPNSPSTQHGSGQSTQLKARGGREVKEAKRECLGIQDQATSSSVEC